MTVQTSRRFVLAGMAGIVALGAGGIAPAAAAPRVQVVKDPYCGCCAAWIDIMARAGFEMEVYDTGPEDLQRFKQASGITDDMASCHTARVEGYTIEGHVPPEDVRRLLDMRTDAVGLSVPGMPIGSPGMGPESEREAYAVYLILPDGRSEVFARYEALL